MGARHKPQQLLMDTLTEQAVVVPSMYEQRSFPSEDALRRTIRICHDHIFTRQGHDPAKAFDELVKVLMAKMYDEAMGGEAHQFTERRGEADADYAKRLRRLYDEAQPHFLGDQREDVSTIELDEDVLIQLARLLAPYSLSRTATAPEGTDIMGVLFESIVTSTFRGSLGAYFTPRNIVEFMVALLEPRMGDHILDPACGTGGFLIGVIQYWRKQLASAAIGAEEIRNQISLASESHIFGLDINSRMARVTKLNLTFHGAPGSIVLNQHGLLADPSPGVQGRTAENGMFDVILANPPFAGFERNRAILSRYATARRSDGSIRSLNKSLPFVEHIIRLLKPGGKCGLVLPTSIFNAQEASFVSLRELILRETKILSIIGLPKTAFVHTDCGVQGALIFLKKEKPRDEYDVFMGWAEQIGYDRLGRPVTENDLPDILRYYRDEWPEESRIRVDDLVHAARIDPDFWHPRNTRLRNSMRHNDSTVVSLSSLFTIRTEAIARRALDDSAEYAYFEVGDCNIDTGEVERIHITTGSQLKRKGRLKLRVRDGDVLLPNHADSLRSKTAKRMGRSAVIVPPEADGAITTDRFIILEPLIDPYLLVEILNSTPVREQLIMNARGAASLDIRPSVLGSVKIPDLEMLGGHLDEVLSLAERARHLRKEIAEVEGKLAAELDKRLSFVK